jgi:polyisoprenoid-binding protein YceI
MKSVALLSGLALVLVSGLASAETFKLDAGSSVMTWKGTKITGASHNGEIRLKSGSLEVEKAAVKSGSFAVDMASLTDLDLVANAEYQTKLMNHLKSEDFFDVVKFPESTFVIEKVTALKDDNYTISGKLTIKGNTQPLSFPAKIKIAKDSAEADGSVVIDRTVWGVKYGSGKFFTDLGDKVIKDDMEIGFKLKATKEVAAAPAPKAKKTPAAKAKKEKSA